MSETRPIFQSPELEPRSALEIDSQHTRFQQVIAGTPAVFYQLVQSPDHSIVFSFLSENCIQFLEVAATTLQADIKQFLDMVHPQDAVAFRTSLNNAAQTQQPWHWQGRLLLPSGTLKWMQMTAGVTAEADGSIRWDGLLLDISARKSLEPGRSHSKAFLQNVINSSADPIFVKDEHHRWVLLNDAFCDFIGHPREDLLGKSSHDIFPKAEADLIWEQDERVLQHGIPHAGEQIVFDAAGQGRQVFIKKTRFRSDTGETFLVGVARDISDRKKIERLLANQAEVLETISAGVSLQDTLTTLIQTIETQSTEVLGAVLLMDPDGQRLRHGAAPSLPEAYCHRIDGMPIRIPIGSCAIGLDSQTTPLTVDVVPDPLWIEVKDIALPYGLQACWSMPILASQGQVLGLFAIYYTQLRTPNALDWQLLATATNLAGIAIERKQAEAALHQSEAQLREQAQQLQQALYDLQRTQAQLVQSEKMSSLGQLVAGIAHEINNPINFIHGNLAYASQYSRDLLTLLQLYQTEFPQVPASVKQQVQTIDLDFIKADLPKLMESMQVGTNRILEIVRSLRTFSRLDEADMKAVDIHGGIDSTLLILSQRLEAQPHRPAIVVIKEYGDLPPVECYAGQMNQVFMNILANAIDALEEIKIWGADPISCEPLKPDSPAPSPSLWSASSPGPSDPTGSTPASPILRSAFPTIHIHTEVLNSDWVVIRIADNGPGISELVRRQIFDPFFTTKPVGRGTGLGMSISYQIVTHKHKGRLQCLSTPGQGTEFVIEIPLHQLNQATNP